LWFCKKIFIHLNSTSSSISLTISKSTFSFSGADFYITAFLNSCHTLLHIHMNWWAVKSMVRLLNLSAMKSEIISNRSSGMCSSKVMSITSSFFYFTYTLVRLGLSRSWKYFKKSKNNYIHIIDWNEKQTQTTQRTYTTHEKTHKKILNISTTISLCRTYSRKTSKTRMMSHSCP
jgi:hypothetical protein